MPGLTGYQGGHFSGIYSSNPLFFLHARLEEGKACVFPKEHVQSKLRAGVHSQILSITSTSRDGPLVVAMSLLQY